MIKGRPYMKHITFIGLLVISCSFSFQAKAQKTITIREAVTQALENNLQVKQAAYQSSLSEQDVL